MVAAADAAERRSEVRRIAEVRRDEGGKGEKAWKRGEMGEERVVARRRDEEETGPGGSEKDASFRIGGSRRVGDRAGRGRVREDGGKREGGREGVGCSNERNLHDFACFSAPRRCAHRVSAVCLRFLLAFLTIRHGRHAGGRIGRAAGGRGRREERNGERERLSREIAAWTRRERKLFCLVFLDVKMLVREEREK